LRFTLPRVKHGAGLLRRTQQVLLIPRDSRALPAAMFDEAHPMKLPDIRFPRQLEADETAETIRQAGKRKKRDYDCPSTQRHPNNIRMVINMVIFVTYLHYIGNLL
jgi:hypothetical protein